MTTLTEDKVEKMTEEEYRAWRVALIEENANLGVLDMELYDILITLNSKGYYTCQSCAGHRLDGEGFIEFATCDMSKMEYHCFVEGAYYLLQQAGLKDIQFTKFNKRNAIGPEIKATFSSIGKRNLYTRGRK